MRSCSSRSTPIARQSKRRPLSAELTAAGSLSAVKRPRSDIRVAKARLGAAFGHQNAGLLRYLARVILWMNGAFGVGKTTTARILREREPSWRLFDPESV